ncbi:acyltransferase [Methylobacterium sp. J-090]|uniref:acyltransferase n=1 Tax=Methylobacterium sp. J-090 TaxID=2836666 RepID=UPI001FBB8EE3|nr:acyltransferase [Methylobacterium sp. J-090]MCJ2082598.1 acyltransferase [Methylobacterium sp. J-090]
MPVRLDIEFPDDNTVTLAPKFLDESNAVVTIRGRGNRLHVEAPLVPNAAAFSLTGGATVIVGMDSNLNGLTVSASAEGAVVEIGAWCSFNGRSQITAHERATIRIGAFCLFGDGCRIASSDVHKVLDVVTRERLNPPGDITIGDHVWAAGDVTILRNAVIGRDTVVGAGSLVRGAFPSNVSLAGVPARVIRTGVTWEF